MNNDMRNYLLTTSDLRKSIGEKNALYMKDVYFIECTIIIKSKSGQGFHQGPSLGLSVPKNHPPICNLQSYDILQHTTHLSRSGP